MAKAVINLQKESGGILKISPVDGMGITEVTVPESGELATVDYVKNNGDINAVTSFSQISGTNEIVGIEFTNNIHDIFNDGSSVATYQLNGNANDLGGAYNGTPANVTYEVGKFGQAAVFNTDANNYIVSNSLLPTLNSFSVSFWAKYDSSQSDVGYGRTMFSFESKFAIVRNKGILGVYYNNVGSVQSSLGSVSDNIFQHIVITYSFGQLKAYIDGSNTNTVSITVNSFQAKALISQMSISGATDNEKFKGSIDQVRIFNRALTETEINTLYTETRVSANAQLNINQGTFIYPKSLGTRGYIKSSDVFTGTVDVSAQTNGWKYVAKDESNNFSFYTDKPTIGKKSSTLYLENGKLYNTVDDTSITPISFLSNKVRIASGVAVELAPSDISKTVSESLEAGSYFGKNAIVAYASIDMTTTPPTILDSYNIASVIRSSNGVGKVTLINPTDIDSVTAICGSNSVAGTITATTKNEISFATGATNYAKTSVIVIGGKF